MTANKFGGIKYVCNSPLIPLSSERESCFIYLLPTTFSHRYNDRCLHQLKLSNVPGMSRKLLGSSSLIDNRQLQPPDQWTPIQSATDSAHTSNPTIPLTLFSNSKGVWNIWQESSFSWANFGLEKEQLLISAFVILSIWNEYRSIRIDCIFYKSKRLIWFVRMKMDWVRWNLLIRPVCIFIKNCIKRDWISFGGLVLGSEEGNRISAALGSTNKAVIFENRRYLKVISH